MTHLSIVILSIAISICTLGGFIGAAAHWIVKKSTAAMDERINERVSENLAPLLDVMKSLNGEPGDESKGIPDRPGILQRQTSTAKQVVVVVADVAAVKEDVRSLRELVQAIMTSLTTNNGGSTLLDKLDRLQRTADRNGDKPLAA